MKKSIVLLTTLAVLGVNSVAMATYWADGAVHNLDYVINSYLQIGGSTIVNVYDGGGTSKWILTQDSSNLNIFDGTFGEGVGARDNSTVVIHSGIFGSRTLSNVGIVVGELSKTTIYGGTYSDTILMYGYGTDDSPILEFHGADFQIGGQDVLGLIDAEELALTGALSKVTSGSYITYNGLLTGTLEDSSILNNMLEIRCFTDGNNANLILIEPTRPIADAGPNQAVIDTDNDGSEQVILDGSASTSIDGPITSWAWTDDLGDTIPDGEVVSVTLSSGFHTITLEVTNDTVVTGTDKVVIIVKPQSTISPVAHWPFDSNSNDIESGFNGTFESSAVITNTPGEFRIGAGAISVDGINDRVFTTFPGIFGSAARTTSAWFKCDGTTGTHQSIFNYGGTSPGSRWGIWINGSNGSIINAMNSGNANSATTGLIDGQWHHVAVTFPAGGTHIQDVKIYLDGYEDATWYTNGDTQTVNTSTDNTFEIGMANGGTILPFNGNIDDVRVYDRELTDAEIVAMQDERPTGNPIIGLSTSNFNLLVAADDSNPADQTLTIGNIYGGTLNWQISESCPWISVSPESGDSSGEADTVTFSVDPAGLTSGFYSCDLVISDPGALNSPQLVTVNLYLGAESDLFVPLEYPTIQSAINAASSGDTVIVAEGTYTGNGNRNINFSGKAITVRSAYGPESCIIDCENNGRAFSFTKRESNNSQLIGFTIRNGYLENDGGAAIYINKSSPTISQCIFENNTAVSTISGHMAFGGAIVCYYYGTPVFSECVFRNNYGGWGGAVGLSIEVSPQFERCQFIDNTTQHLGGAIFVTSGVNATLHNCLFNGNSGSSKSSAIHNHDSNLQILHSTFYGNNKESSRVIYHYSGSYGGILTIKNTIMWDVGVQEIYLDRNTSNDAVKISYSNIIGSWPGEGNISLYPQFVDPDNDNYHLMPTSPCIDAGDNSVVKPKDSHWKLDEASGPTAYDSTGNNDGTLYGNPVWTTGQIDGALEFDGIDDYIEMDITSYKGVLGTRSRTCAAWIKTTSDGAIISWGDSDISGGWWLFRIEDAGRLRLQTQGGRIIGNTDLRDNNWHHVIALLDSDSSPDNSEVKLYVDGVEEIYSEIDGQPIDTAGHSNVTIGASYMHDGTVVIPFTVQIDDVHVYDRALSAEEIQQLYQGDNSVVSGATDLDGNPRIMDGDGDGVAIVDMGAYEFIPNTAPVADAGQDVMISADENCGAVVILDGSGSSDENGDELSYYWYYDDQLFAEGETAEATLGLGEHVFELIVNDGTEDSEPDEIVITVVDNTEPEFSVVMDPSELWPPNHNMIEVEPVFTVSDNCSDDITIELASITSNESDETNTFDLNYDNTLGDGHTIDDIQVDTDETIYLRAERSGEGDGRVYILTYRAVDQAGNQSLARASVFVPHDQGQHYRGKLGDRNNDLFINYLDLAELRMQMAVGVSSDSDLLEALVLLAENWLE